MSEAEGEDVRTSRDSLETTARREAQRERDDLRLDVELIFEAESRRVAKPAHNPNVGMPKLR